MKRIIYTLALGLFSTMAIANSGPGMSAKASATNLKEVSESIQYPLLSNQEGVEGTVLFYVELDENGKVTSKTALSFPSEQLRDAAEKAIDDITFTPAKDENGNTIASGLRIPFQFELKVD